MRLPLPARSTLARLTIGVATITVGGLAAGSLSPANAAGDTWPVSGSRSIVVSGHGYGHGHGMSQWGAQGAGLQGVGYQSILDFYYPGTAVGRAKGKIAVLIAADTSRDVKVDPVAGLVVRNLDKKATYRLAKARPKASAYRLKPSGSRTKVQYKQGGWRTLTAFKGAAEFRAGGKPITLKTSAGRTAYRGSLRSVEGDTVNVVPMESYLRGVIAAEMPSTWTPAALQAQAVAARTYAAFERDSSSASRHFQVYDSTRSQVYGGADAEQPTTDAAIRATKKQVQTYNGAPAFTQFSSSNGGWTSAGSQPYLVAQADPYDAAGGADPHTNWSLALRDTSFEQRWPQIGDLTQIAVPVRDGNGDLGGRADSVVLTGTGGSVTVTGEDFRFLMGLRSDWFTFTVS